MTRRHYRNLIDGLRGLVRRGELTPDQAFAVASMLVDVLATEDRAFSPSKFMTAAGKAVAPEVTQ